MRATRGLIHVFEHSKGAAKERVKRFLEGWRAAQQCLRFSLWVFAVRSGGSSTTLFRIGEVDFSLRHSDWNGFREIFVEGEYEIVSELLGSETKPTVLDLGANVGLFSVFVFSRFPLARVVSVEPSSTTFKILVRNSEMNPSLRWEYRWSAVDDQDGIVQFQNAPVSTASRMADTGDEEVPASTLSSIITGADLETVDLLKLDVEGAEKKALKGAGDVVRRVRNLLVEVHPEVDFDAFCGLLAAAFPHVYRIRRSGSSKPLLLATRQPFESSLLELIH